MRVLVRQHGLAVWSARASSDDLERGRWRQGAFGLTSVSTRPIQRNDSAVHRYSRTRTEVQYCVLYLWCRGIGRHRPGLGLPKSATRHLANFSERRTAERGIGLACLSGHFGSAARRSGRALTLARSSARGGPKRQLRASKADGPSTVDLLVGGGGAWTVSEPAPPPVRRGHDGRTARGSRPPARDERRTAAHRTWSAAGALRHVYSSPPARSLARGGSTEEGTADRRKSLGETSSPSWQACAPHSAHPRTQCSGRRRAGPDAPRRAPSARPR